MQIKNVKTPQWANAEHTIIDVTLETDTYSEIPFSASPDDVEAYGREIFADAVAGKFGPVAEYMAHVPTAEEIRAGKIAEMARIEAELGMTRVMRESMLMTLPDCYQRTKIQEAEDRIAAIRATV